MCINFLKLVDAVGYVHKVFMTRDFIRTLIIEDKNDFVENLWQENRDIIKDCDHISNIQYFEECTAKMKMWCKKFYYKIATRTK